MKIEIDTDTIAEMFQGMSKLESTALWMLIWYLLAAIVIGYWLRKYKKNHPNWKDEDAHVFAGVVWIFSPALGPLAIAVTIISIWAWIISLGLVRPIWEWEARS